MVLRNESDGEAWMASVVLSLGEKSQIHCMKIQNEVDGGARMASAIF